MDSNHLPSGIHIQVFRAGDQHIAEYHYSIFHYNIVIISPLVIQKGCS